MSLKYCGGEDESGVEYKSWCLHVLVGGGSRRYYGERAGVTVIFLAQAKEAQAFDVRLTWMELRLE